MTATLARPRERFWEINALWGDTVIAETWKLGVAASVTRWLPGASASGALQWPPWTAGIAAPSTVKLNEYAAIPLAADLQTTSVPRSGAALTSCVPWRLATPAHVTIGTSHTPRRLIPGLPPL